MGDLFRVRFVVQSAADAEVLVTFMGEGGSGLGQSALTVRLYDGATLLGALENYQDTVAFWKSRTSSFANPALAIDFQPIVTGAIDGRVEYAVTRGAPSVERLDLATILLLNANLNTVGGIRVTARELCR